MKKSIFILGITTFISAMTFAQTNKSTNAKSETLQMKSAAIKREATPNVPAFDSKYLKTLGVSEDKIMDAQKINNALNEKIAAVKSSEKLSASEKQKLQAEYEMKRSSAIKGIIGEENFNKYQKHLSN